MIVEELLPAHIRAKATLRGNEYAWPLLDVEEAIRAATSLTLVTVGGQVQFRLPNATCELYWLNADATTKRTGETWEDYVDRSASEVITVFRRIREEVDIVADGVESFNCLKREAERGVDISQWLCFVLYFAEIPKR